MGKPRTVFQILMVSSTLFCVVLFCFSGPITKEVLRPVSLGLLFGVAGTLALGSLTLQHFLEAYLEQHPGNGEPSKKSKRKKGSPKRQPSESEEALAEAQRSLDAVSSFLQNLARKLGISKSGSPREISSSIASEVESLIAFKKEITERQLRGLRRPNWRVMTRLCWRAARALVSVRILRRKTSLLFHRLSEAQQQLVQLQQDKRELAALLQQSDARVQELEAASAESARLQEAADRQITDLRRAFSSAKQQAQGMPPAAAEEQGNLSQRLQTANDRVNTLSRDLENLRAENAKAIQQQASLAATWMRVIESLRPDVHARHIVDASSAAAILETLARCWAEMQEILTERQKRISDLNAECNAARQQLSETIEQQVSAVSELNQRCAAAESDARQRQSEAEELRRRLQTEQGQHSGALSALDERCRKAEQLSAEQQQALAALELRLSESGAQVSRLRKDNVPSSALAHLDSALRTALPDPAVGAEVLNKACESEEYQTLIAVELSELAKYGWVEELLAFISVFQEKYPGHKTELLNACLAEAVGYPGGPELFLALSSEQQDTVRPLIQLGAAGAIAEYFNDQVHTTEIDACSLGQQLLLFAAEDPRDNDIAALALLLLDSTGSLTHVLAEHVPRRFCASNS